jgi:hypothetical protein
MRKFNLLLVGILLMVVKPVNAQITENHIGIRGGIHSGIYYQNLISAGTAEKSFFIMLSADTNNARLTVLRIFYETSLSKITDNLFFTWGYGGHAGFSVTDYAYFLGKKYQFEYEQFRPLAGIDAWAGIEYRVLSIPMIIGLNLKPYFEIMAPGFISLQPGDIGLSIAYRF